MNLLKQLEEYTKYSRGLGSNVTELFYRNETIKGVDFSKFDLNNAVFLDSHFSDCKLNNVYMSGTNFGGSTFDKCLFDSNTINKAEWDYVRILRCKLNGISSFRTFYLSAVIEETEAYRCEFSRCSFSESSMSGCSFRECYFRDCNFDRIDFANVTFSHCAFEDCQISNKKGLNLSECKIYKTEDGNTVKSKYLQ